MTAAASAAPDFTGLVSAITAAITAASGGSSGPSPPSMASLETAVRAVAGHNTPSPVIVAQLVLMGYSADAFGSIPWFCYTPATEHRSSALSVPRYSLAQLQLNFYRRELRRQTGAKDADSVALSESAIFGYFKNTSSGGRVYASERATFHVALVETRYELLITCHNLPRVCDRMLQLLLHAARRVHAVSPVLDRIEGVARSGGSDVAIHEVLRVIESVLLPLTDTDDQALLSVRWHPTDSGEYVVRTAHQLAQKLFNIASFGAVAARDGTVLSHFRTQVNVARQLQNLQVDNVTKLSLADNVYERFCSSDARGRYPTAASLLSALGVPLSIGDRPLEFKEERREERGRDRERRTDTRTAKAAAAAAKQAAAAAAKQADTDDDSADDSDPVEELTEVFSVLAVSPGEKEPLDLEVVKQHGHAITLRGSDRRDIPVGPILATAELYNKQSADGKYGGTDIGACPICIALNPGLTRSLSMAAIKKEIGGKPTTASSPVNDRPWPPDVVIPHFLDQCHRIHHSARFATTRNRNPLDAAILSRIPDDLRLERMRASAANQGVTFPS